MKRVGGVAAAWQNAAVRKRWRATALHDASRFPLAYKRRGNVLECASPLAFGLGNLINVGLGARRTTTPTKGTTKSPQPKLASVPDWANCVPAQHDYIRQTV